MVQNHDLNKVQINVLKKRQYDEITPSEDEIYLLTDVNEHQVFLISVSDTAPTTCADEDKYYNTTTHHLYEYDVETTTWEDIGLQTTEILYIDKSNNCAYVYTDNGNFIQISSSGAGSGSTDDVTINLNNASKLQTIGIIEKNTGSVKYDWVGTKAQYDALQTYNNNWMYYITDDQLPSENNSFNNILQRLNKAYAWTYNNTTVYTVPEPEVNFSAYTSVSDSTTGSTITTVTSTTVKVGSTTYTRDTTKDSVFVFVPDDTKNQLLSVYDLINAIRG